jgi:hypothetical protein
VTVKNTVVLLRWCDANSHEPWRRYDKFPVFRGTNSRTVTVLYCSVTIKRSINNVLLHYVQKLLLGGRGTGKINGGPRQGQRPHYCG